MALQFKHLGETLTIEGSNQLEARAEVGLLSHNVVVRGSDNVQWHDVIEACPAGFDPGMEESRFFHKPYKTDNHVYHDYHRI